MLTLYTEAHRADEANRAHRADRAHRAHGAHRAHRADEARRPHGAHRAERGPTGFGLDALDAHDEQDAPIERLVEFCNMQLGMLSPNEELKDQIEGALDGDSGRIRGRWLGATDIANFASRLPSRRAVRHLSVEVLSMRVCTHGEPGFYVKHVRKAIDYTKRFNDKKKENRRKKRHKHILTRSYRDLLASEIVDQLEASVRGKGLTVEAIVAKLATQSPPLRTLLAPINAGGSHWTFAHVAYDAAAHTVVLTHFDSLGGSVAERGAEGSSAFHCHEIIRAFNGIDPRTATKGHVRIVNGASPRQTDCVNCGVFVCIAMFLGCVGAVPNYGAASADDIAVAITKVRRVIAATLAANAKLERERAARRTGARDDGDVSSDDEPSHEVVEITSD